VLQCLQNTPSKGMWVNLLPADGTPEELEQCFTVSVEYFETHRWTDPVEPGYPFVPGRKQRDGRPLSHRSAP